MLRRTVLLNKLRYFLNFSMFSGEGIWIHFFDSESLVSLDVSIPAVIHFSFLWKFWLNFTNLGEKKLLWSVSNWSENILNAQLGSNSSRTFCHGVFLRKFENLFTFWSEKSRLSITFGLDSLFWVSLKKTIGKWSDILQVRIHDSNFFVGS